MGGGGPVRRDHYRYDREKIEALLPAVWDPEFGVLASKAEQVRSGGGDPATSGDLLALVMDVRSAWDRLHKLDHELLHARYHHGLSLTAIAELGGYESEQEVQDDLDRVVNEMIESLGG